MKSLSIIVETKPGAHLPRAIEEAQQLSDFTGQEIRVTFNGRDLIAKPGGDESQIWGQWK